MLAPSIANQHRVLVIVIKVDQKFSIYNTIRNRGYDYGYPVPLVDIANIYI